MTVNLSGPAEAYVQELLHEGSYASAEQVVDSLNLKQRADERFDTEFPTLAPERIEQELLKGVRSAHRPWRSGDFRELADRMIAERAGNSTCRTKRS